MLHIDEAVLRLLHQIHVLIVALSRCLDSTRIFELEMQAVKTAVR